MTEKKKIDTHKKARIRIQDRKWFIRVLGKSFMLNKEIHHEWDMLSIPCRILDSIEHRKLHGVSAKEHHWIAVRVRFRHTEEQLQRVSVTVNANQWGDIDSIYVSRLPTERFE